MTVEPPTDEAFATDPETDGGARGDLVTDIAFVLGITNDAAREWIAHHGRQAAEERTIDYWGGGA
jgi:hypothetical protein